MNWKSFTVGFVAALALSAGGTIWLLNKLDASRDLLSPRKEFFDFPAKRTGDGYVRFSGALGGGEPLGSPNNIFTATCREDRMECTTADIQQTDSTRVGDINTDTYHIETWTADRIVATSGPNMPVCVSVTLDIDRRSEVIKYIRKPRPGPKPKGLCQSLEQRVMVWTIEDAPMWRKVS